MSSTYDQPQSQPLPKFAKLTTTDADAGEGSRVSGSFVLCTCGIILDEGSDILTSLALSLLLSEMNTNSRNQSITLTHA